jgi:hypothetical protein
MIPEYQKGWFHTYQGNAARIQIVLPLFALQLPESYFADIINIAKSHKSWLSDSDLPWQINFCF